MIFVINHAISSAMRVVRRKNVIKVGFAILKLKIRSSEVRSCEVRSCEVRSYEKSWKKGGFQWTRLQ